MLGPEPYYFDYEERYPELEPWDVRPIWLADHDAYMAKSWQFMYIMITITASIFPMLISMLKIEYENSLKRRRELIYLIFSNPFLCLLMPMFIKFKSGEDMILNYT